MKAAAALSLGAWALAAVPAQAAELRVDENGALTELLTGLDQLHSENFASGLQVRLYRTSELKACEAGHEAATCPRGQLLVVALVIQGGTGAAMMWRSSFQLGWEFVRLIDSVGTARNPGSRSFGEAHFEVKSCEALPAVNSGALPAAPDSWREMRYRLTVTLEAASLMPVASGGACVPK